MSRQGLGRSGLLAAVIGVTLLLPACGRAELPGRAVPAGTASGTGLGGSPAASPGRGQGKDAVITLSPGTARSPSGPVRPDALATAAGIIRRRLSLLGLQHVRVAVAGQDVVLTGPEPSQAQLALLTKSARLAFRPALLMAPHAAPSASTSAAYGDTSKVDKATMKLFGKLTCKPGPNAATVNDSWKKTVGYTPAKAQWDNLKGQVVSCDPSGNKYVLGPAVIDGTQLASVNAAPQTSSTQWVVNLTLDGKATATFGKLTTYQYEHYYPNASTSNDDQVLDQTAIVLDGNVAEAPMTEGALTSGTFIISGPQPKGFTEAAARNLAALLKSGALPVSFRVSAISQVASISAATASPSQAPGGR